jgi:hypothetical protein
MKAILLASLALTLSSFATPSFAQTLTLLGSNDFTIDPGSTTAAYSQSATALSFSGSQALGDTVGGVFVSTYDWSSAPAFGLTMSVTGTNPNMTFGVEFYNSLFQVISSYEGSTAGASLTPTLVDLDFLSFGPGAGDFSQVAGMQFTWNTQGSINVTIDNVAVPEPSTWALLFCSAVLVGGLAWRRRCAAARR